MQWWRSLRTAFNLANRVEDLEAQWQETQIEIADRIDKLDRLLRRLTTRANRAGELVDRGAHDVELQRVAGGKDELRSIARQRGLIR